MSHTKLESIDIDTAVRDVDYAKEDVVCTLEEYRDQVIEVKTELATLNTSLLSPDVATDVQEQAHAEKAVFTGSKNDFVY